jgi:hypothetical protein
LHDDRDLFGVCLNAPSTDDAAQEDTRWNTKYAICRIQLPPILFEGLECLLEVGDKLIGGLGLNDYVIDVGLNVVPYLIFKVVLNGSLICCTSVFESEGHGGVTVGVEWCNEGHFDLVLLFQGDLVITRITIQKRK